LFSDIPDVAIRRPKILVTLAEVRVESTRYLIDT
jgi:hypothetical protein